MTIVLEDLKTKLKAAARLVDPESRHATLLQLGIAGAIDAVDRALRVLRASGRQDVPIRSRLRMTREEAIREITRRIVEASQPVRIYLFGSAARGDSTADSDLDFLVVVPDGAPEDVVRGTRLYRAIRGIPHAVDIVPWRRTDFEGRAAHVVASLPATVVREGKLLYDAERMAA